MFTLVAFSESIDEAGVFANIAAVSDQHVKTSGDKITIPALNQLMAAYAAIGTTGVEARLVSPSLRRLNPQYITPVELLLEPADDPAMLYRGDNPIPLDVNEDLEVEVNANPAAAEQHTIGVWLSDGQQPPANGQIFTVNCEITLALLAGAWAFSEITFPDSLPVAEYDIVGARCNIGNGVLFRFVGVGTSHRPGGICSNAANSKDPFLQRYGRLGNWMTFQEVQPPGIEVLGSAAVGSATYQVYIDLIKRG